MVGWRGARPWIRFAAAVSAVAVGLGLIGYEAFPRANRSGAPSDATSVAVEPLEQEMLAESTDNATPTTSAPTGEAPVPNSGTGRFVTAPGGSAPVGAGRVLRYLVNVEIGSNESPPDFAAAVEKTLADPRGWTVNRRWAFQRVSTGPSDFTVHLTTSATTMQMCDRYGIRTQGEVSCRVGRNVVINLKRWRLAVPWYSDALTEYRHMVVNHEVGHFLGHGHALCPAAGKLAPVMQRQSFGLQGCQRNAWPYPDGETFVTGPAAPR
jgi:hypothetical protein